MVHPAHHRTLTKKGVRNRDTPHAIALFRPQGRPQARRRTSSQNLKLNLITSKSSAVCTHEASAPSRPEAQRKFSYFPTRPRVELAIPFALPCFDAFSSTVCRLWVSAVFRECMLLLLDMAGLFILSRLHGLLPRAALNSTLLWWQADRSV